MITEGGEKIKVEFSNKGFGRKRERGNKHLIHDIIEGRFDITKIKDLKNILMRSSDPFIEIGIHPEKNGAQFVHYFKTPENYKEKKVYIGIREVYLASGGRYFNVYTIRNE